MRSGAAQQTDLCGQGLHRHAIRDVPSDFAQALRDLRVAHQRVAGVVERLDNRKRRVPLGHGANLAPAGTIHDLAGDSRIVTAEYPHENRTGGFVSLRGLRRRGHAHYRGKANANLEEAGSLAHRRAGGSGGT